ncbi:PIG-L deacetylase family protein [Virgibacillus sediminis]|uniref:PIG-L deacetylase family protein n=1 Tax=Virgibacillus sediminis TaxID=202260 RepID=A0ABV7A3E3_9BACI
MNAKQLIIGILKPINIPVTRFMLKRHYQASKVLADTTGARKVLVLAPHMDDETIGPGGVIRKHANEGAEVHCAFVTDGSNSVSDLSKDELIHTRMKEMEEAKGILGIDSIHYMGLPDGKVESNEESRRKFRDIIETVQPDIIYCTSYVDAHTDHTQTAKTLADVLKDMEDPSMTLRLYEINCPIPPSFVNCVMDISDTVADKKRAIEVFSSQAIAFDGFLELNRLKRELAAEDIQAAEVFVEPTIPAFIQHCEYLENEYYPSRFPELFKQANRTDTLLWAIYKNFRLKKRLYENSFRGKEN